MEALILIAVALAILYGLWLVLNFVFTQIETYHAAWREERTRAADPRPDGGEQVGEKVA